MSTTSVMTIDKQVKQVAVLTKKQLKGIDLRADGNSWDQVAKKLDVHPRTIHRWRALSLWDDTLRARQKEWIEEYEAKFTRMMPSVAHTHIKLLQSSNETIQMRAVDSAHSNHVRCVREQETKTEIEELRDMVHMLVEQLVQQRAAG